MRTTDKVFISLLTYVILSQIGTWIGQPLTQLHLSAFQMVLAWLIVVFAFL
jgi:hypothetical protein